MTVNRDPAAIETLIIGHLARMRAREPAAIDPLRPFNELGVDSLDAITLTGDLERDLGRDIDPAVILEHPTPRAFAVHLAGGAA